MKDDEEPTLQEMVDQLFMLGISDNDMDCEDIEEVKRFNPGSVIITLRYFHKKGSTDPGLLRKTCDVVHGWKGKPLIGIDHEGGRIQHLPPPNYTFFPAEGQIGELNDEKLALDLGAAMGKQLRTVGIDWNFAPVLDVSHHPEYHFRHIKRSISADPSTTAKIGAALIRGMQQEGIIACPKHFPGMGGTPDDSHFKRPVISNTIDQLDKMDFYPFRTVFSGEYAALSYMTNHALYPVLDPSNVATLSQTILGISLSKETVNCAEGTVQGMGFEGIVLTDDLGMAGVLEGSSPGEVAVKALKAGVDVLMFSFRIERAKEAKEAVLKALEDGSLEKDVVERSYKKIMAVKHKLETTRHSLPDYKIEDLPQIVKQHEELILKFEKESDILNAKTSVGADVGAKKDKCIVS